MKYKVSVIKLVTLVMIGALAVAMVACTAAAKPGPAGPPGEQGPPGQDAPTPDPPETDPPETDPPEPTGAAPEVTMMFPDVYLSLDGNGDKNRSFTLREHFADIDSLLKYTVASSDAAIATAAVTDGVLKVTAVKDGSTTITVTAADDEGSMTAADDFSVTVAKTNAVPTTHGLSITDSTKLGTKLYYREGPQTYKVTVVSDAGAATGAVAVTDAILADPKDFNIVIGDAKKDMPKVDDPADNKISVAVTRTGTHDYTIVITPNATGFSGKPSQDVMIYPMDMFRAPVKDPWKFTVMYNTPPQVLSKSFHLELKRSADSDAAVDGFQPMTVTAGASGAGATGQAPGNVGRVNISDFFVWSSLERMPEDPAAPIVVDDFAAFATAPVAALATPTATDIPADKIDKVTDTVCTASLSSAGYAVVMSLNEAGKFLVDPRAETTTGTPETNDNEREVDHKDVIVDVMKRQSLNAIRIDSRFKDLGGDGVQTANPEEAALGNPETYAMYQKNMDMTADKTGTVTVTISCTDKDETETVTGTVVVRS